MADTTLANIHFNEGLVFFHEAHHCYYYIESVKPYQPHDILYCLQYDVERQLPLVELEVKRFSAHEITRAIWECSAFFIDPNDNWETPSPTPAQTSGMEMWQEFIRILKRQNDDQLPRADKAVRKAIQTMDWAKFNDKPKGLSRCQAVIKQYDEALHSKGPHQANLAIMPHGQHAMQGMSRIAPATEDLLLKYIDDEYLVEKPDHRVNPAEIYRAFKIEFEELHKADSKAYPKLPCKETFYKRLRQLDQVIVSTMRLSSNARRAVAKRRKTEFIVDRILQRVEFDAIHIGMGIIKYEGTGRKRKAVYRGRIVLMLAIDVYSRSILGYSYHIAKKPGESADLAVECFKNVLMPKADSRRPMHGKPFQVISDGTTASTGNQFHEIVTSTGAIHPVTPSYQPWKKPFIERFMLTLRTQFLSKFDTYLGSKLFRNHDHLNNGDSVEKAVVNKNKKGKMNKHRLTEEQFVEALDDFLAIYHTNPHKGLGGYSPLEVWQQSVRENPKDQVTLPSSHSIFSRLGLKTKKARVINRDGVVTVNNAQYGSPALKDLYGRMSSLDVYYSDINSQFVSFEIDHKWHTAELLPAIYTPGDTSQRAELDRARDNRYGPEKPNNEYKDYRPDMKAEVLPEEESKNSKPATKPIDISGPNAAVLLGVAEAASLANAPVDPLPEMTNMPEDDSDEVDNEKDEATQSTGIRRRGKVGDKL